MSVDVEPVDITADRYGGWDPAVSSARGPQPRPQWTRRRLARRERAVALVLSLTLLGGVLAALTIPAPLTAAQLLAGSYRGLQSAGTVGFDDHIDSQMLTLTASGSLDLRDGLLGQIIAGKTGGTREVRTPTTTYLRQGVISGWLSVPNRVLSYEVLSQANLGTVVTGPQPLLAALPMTTDIRAAGHSVIDGVGCRHLLGRLTGRAAELSLGIQLAVNGAAVVSADVDACLSATGRPVLVIERFAVLAPAREAISPIRTTLSVQLRDVGAPVTISPPPAAEVSPLD